MSSKLVPWKVLTSFHPSHYQFLTQEVARIDYKTLCHIHPAKFANFDRWEESSSIRVTSHAMEDRLKPYIGRLSRDKSYVELTTDEYQQILRSDLKSCILERSAQLVELGFNRLGYICKAAYVYQLPSRRFLFFCLGMDYGLKTLYVTPQFKHRTQYQGMTYLSIEEANQL